MHPEEDALLSQDDGLSQEIIDAKEKEIKSLMKNKVFQVVPNENQVCISSHWVITEKIDSDRKKVTKARLFAKGYEGDSRNIPKHSPTCSCECFRLLFAVMS